MLSSFFALTHTRTHIKKLIIGRRPKLLNYRRSFFYRPCSSRSKYERRLGGENWGKRLFLLFCSFLVEYVGKKKLIIFFKSDTNEGMNVKRAIPTSSHHNKIHNAINRWGELIKRVCVCMCESNLKRVRVFFPTCPNYFCCCVFCAIRGSASKQQTCEIIGVRQVI